MQEFLQPLLPEEERHYLILSRQGDMNARNLLVEHNLRLVAHIVKKYHNLDREKEDMISIGVIGLIKAINTYDIRKNPRDDAEKTPICNESVKDCRSYFGPGYKNCDKSWKRDQFVVKRIYGVRMSDAESEYRDDEAAD